MKTEGFIITHTNSSLHFYFIIIIIVIIIFLHGLVSLTCSGIDALPSFPGAPTVSSSSKFEVEGVFRESGVVRSFEVVVQGCASLLMSTLFSLGGLPTHPQNPHPWRTSLSLLVWPLSYALSSLGGPTRNRKFPPA